MIEFFESVVGTFRITQPGSSVATSLVSGEAARKKIGILDIKGKNFRLHPVPLTQVRSFVTTELSLREYRADLDPDDPKIDSKVTKLLEEEVQLMVMSARDKWKEVLIDARAAGSDAGEIESALKYKLQRPEEVLVRIRVEHFGFSSLNNQRFGAKFVGDVANPSDILLFHRKKDAKLASTVKTTSIQPIAPEELERTNMEDLVREQLSVPDGKLQILGEKDLSEALEEFVDKSVTAAITDVATDMLTKTQKTLIKGRKGEEVVRKGSDVLEQTDLLSGKMSQPSTRTAGRPAAAVLNESSFRGDEDDDSDIPQPTALKNPNSSRVRRPVALDLSDDDIEVAKKSAPSAKAKPAERPKRGATKRKVAYALGESDDDDVESDAIVDEDDGDFQSAVGPKAVVSKSRTKPKAAPKRKAATSTTARTKAASKPPRRNEFDDSDDDDQYLGEGAGLDADWGTANTRTQKSEWG